MAERGALTSLADKGVLPTEPGRREQRQWRRQMGSATKREILSGWLSQHWRDPACPWPKTLCDAGGASPVCLTSVQGQIRTDAERRCLSLSLSPPFSLCLWHFFIFLSCFSYVLPLPPSHILWLSLFLAHRHTLTRRVSLFLLWYLAVRTALHLFVYVIVLHLEAGCYNKSEDRPHTETSLISFLSARSYCHWDVLRVPSQASGDSAKLFLDFTFYPFPTF